MKKLSMVALLLASLLFASVAQATWITNGIITNPTANQIISDTGALTAEQATYGHDYDLIISSTVATAVVVEWRDATNTTNVWSHIIAVPAFTSFALTVRYGGGPIMQTGERIRLRMNAAATGSVQGSVNFFY